MISFLSIDELTIIQPNVVHRKKKKPGIGYITEEQQHCVHNKLAKSVLPLHY